MELIQCKVLLKYQDQVVQNNREYLVVIPQPSSSQGIFNLANTLALPTQDTGGSQESDNF
jgi:hypothetical protein